MAKTVVLTKNQLVKILKELANSHYQIKGFGYGNLSNISTCVETAYALGNDNFGKSSSPDKCPIMWVTPIRYNLVGKELFYNFDILICDLVKKDEDVEAQGLEIESDTALICLDLCSMLDNQFKDRFYNVRNTTIDPFEERFNDDYTGHIMTFSLKSPFNYNLCQVPAIPINHNPDDEETPGGNNCCFVPHFLWEHKDAYLLENAAEGDLIKREGNEWKAFLPDYLQPESTFTEKGVLFGGASKIKQDTDNFQFDFATKKLRLSADDILGNAKNFLTQRYYKANSVVNQGLIGWNWDGSSREATNLTGVFFGANVSTSQTNASMFASLINLAGENVTGWTVSFNNDADKAILNANHGLAIGAGNSGAFIPDGRFEIRGEANKNLALLKDHNLAEIFKVENGGNTYARHLLPFAHNAYDIGINASRWRSVYTQNYYGNYTNGSVLFAGANGLISENNNQFYWDNVNNRFGLGTNSPSNRLDVLGKSLTGSDTEGAVRIRQTWNTTGNVNTFEIDVTNIGSGTSSKLFNVKLNGTDILYVQRNGSRLTTGDVQQLSNANWIEAGASGGLRISANLYKNAISNFAVNGISKGCLLQSIGVNNYYGGHVFVSGHNNLDDSQCMAIVSNFTTTSGAITHRTLYVQTAITQTAGGTGITRAVFIDPTTVNAYDFRALEIGSGKVMLNGTGVHSYMVLHRLTTTERNALMNIVNGSMIYNTTTDKFQGYAAGAWVDLH